jgi:hydrogenase nickel incorporation protein HypB
MARSKIKVYHDLMGANDVWAARTRETLRRSGARMLNVIGSPGAGKTALLEATAPRLRGRKRMAVLEGDCATTHDAERLNRIGVKASQILTDGGCHLQARSVHQALRDLPPEAFDLVIVENVGNLVCPSEFDLGEHGKVAVLSVAEGEDKPVKYPMLFREAAAVVLTKIDLLPHLPFSMKKCMQYIRQVNGVVPVFQLSALKGDGLAEWVEWLERL